MTRKTHTTAYGLEYQQKFKQQLKQQQQPKPHAPPATKIVPKDLPTSRRNKEIVALLSADVIPENIISSSTNGVVTRKRVAPAHKIIDTNLAPINLPSGFPKTLSQLPYSSNTMVFGYQLMGIESAMFLCCLEICAVCGSPGNVDHMIFCVDCGECFHAFCVDAPLDAMCEFAANVIISESGIAPYDRWRCANCCEYCARCQKKAKSDTHMLHCKLCENTYHMKCVSPNMSVHVAEWVCGECMTIVPCVICKEFDETADRYIEKLVGKIYFQDKKKIWGTDSVCLKCLCMQKYLAGENVESLIPLNTLCTVCKLDCSNPTETEEGEMSARQCLCCFRYTHMACRRDHNTSDIDLESVDGEYMCDNCWIMSDPRYDCIDTLLQVRSIRRTQLTRIHQQMGMTSQRDCSNEWEGRKLTKVLMALISWAAHCCQNISKLKLDRDVYDFILLCQDQNAVRYSRHIKGARIFLRIWKSHSHLSEEYISDRQECLLKGGLYVAKTEKRRMENFHKLAHLAGSFLCVTMQEWRIWSTCSSSSPVQVIQPPPTTIGLPDAGDITRPTVRDILVSSFVYLKTYLDVCVGCP